MLGERIKQYRLAAGYNSLDKLAEAIGGIVSKTALSKYERNIIKPSPKVLAAIAEAVDAKIMDLAEEPSYKVYFIAYRKGYGLSRSQPSTVENYVKKELELLASLQQKFNPTKFIKLPISNYKINKIEDAERAAEDIRKKWQLGIDPINNLTSIIEDRNIHVLFVNANNKFDGISAFIKDANNRILTAAVVSRSGLVGERQRLNLAHELAHLFLSVSQDLDEETAAFRFAGSFLCPRQSLIERIGEKRNHLQFNELMLNKRYYGISLQALLYRLKDLGIISQSYYKTWCKIISKKGWRKNEPGEIAPEKSDWFERTILRAYAENKISLNEAEKLLKKESFDKENRRLSEKRNFLKLSLQEKRKLLSEQVKEVKEDYKIESDFKEFILEDIIE